MCITPEDLSTQLRQLLANPDIDSPESLLATMSRLSGFYFEANDFPIDVLITILLRNEALLQVTQSQLSAEERVADEVLSHMVWAIEGLNSEALTVARMWGLHHLAKQRREREPDGYALALH